MQCFEFWIINRTLIDKYIVEMWLVPYRSNHVQVFDNFLSIEQIWCRIALHAVERNFEKVFVFSYVKALFCCADIYDVCGKVFRWILFHHLPDLVNIKRNLCANVFASGCSTENQLMTVAAAYKTTNTKLTCLIYAILS